MANPQAENGHVDIANEIMDHLAKIRIPGEARQVLDFILRKTYGWHKKEDRISLSQFVDGTGLNKPHICNAIQKLLYMRLITKKGNDTITEKGNDWTIYEFQKDFDEWLPLPKKVTLPKKVMNVTEKGKESLPKKVHTKENTTKETITKEKILPDVKLFIDFYFEEFKRTFGNPPIIEGGKDGVIVKRLLKDIPIDELKSLLISFFESDDKFILQSGYTIGLFKSQIQGLRIKAKRGKQDGISSATQKLKDAISGQKQITDNSG